MARRNTKADRILNDSEMRLEAARIRERAAQSQLNTAKAVLEFMQDAHDALLRELTPTPRKAPKKKQEPPPTAPTLLPDNETKEPMCAVCGNGPDYKDHFQHSPAYHPFESSARTTSKRSSRKGSGT